MTAHEIATARYHAWVGATLFAVGATFAVVHLGILAGIHGFSVMTVAEIVVAITWALAAIAMGAQIGRLAFFPVAGAWLAVIYGFVMSIGTLWPGLPFIVSGVVLAYLGARSAPLFRDPPQFVSGHP